MSVIDKSMYKNLKSWCDGSRPENQYMIYVNSCDRGLTGATVRKLMFDEEEEDIHGDEYVSVYSAKSFYRNMREYYSHVAEMYLRNPDDGASINDIIESIPSTCGWITLIIEDVEALADDAEKTEEMFRSLLSFACKRSKIILIGNRDYKKAFSGCEFVLRAMAELTASKQEENLLTIGYYDQEETPEKESITYDTEEEKGEELYYYWDIVYKRLENGYFDYNGFKSLIKETLEYLIPRVTEKQVFRRDLRLIEKTGAMQTVKNGITDGCEPWEFDASREIAMRLYSAIADKNDDFSPGKISIGVMIKDPVKTFDGGSISGYVNLNISLSVDTVCKKMDSLAEAIRNHTYEKNGNVVKLYRELVEDED